MSLEWSITVAVLTLLGNAFFVGAEFGLVSARRSSIELRAASGSRAAKITLAGMEQVSMMLAGAQLGVTLCSLVFGAVGEPLVAHLLEAPFAVLGFSEVARHAVAFAIALASMVYVHVVIGEMVPKNLALAGPTKAALLLVPPLYYIVKAIRPVISLLNAIANGVLRILGIKPRDEIASSFNRDEVIGFVQESHREGLLSSEEQQLLSGSLEFDSRTIQRIITPVNKLVATSAKPTVAEIEQLIRDTGYSRFPVAKGKKGDLKGYIHIKDILHLENGQSPASVIRTLPMVAPTDSARTALRTMQRTGAHIAEVVNARGRLVGVVMLEDVLEQLVGTIRDETQRQTV